MTKQTILFDLDDTLVHCNKYFHEVLKKFAQTLVGWFSSYNLHEADILKCQVEMDLAGIEQQGLIPERFPESLVETYVYFCKQYGLQPEQQHIIYVKELGFSVYEVKAEPYPYLHETLSQLQGNGHTLCLYTGGESSIQMRKVHNANLASYFQERIFVTIHKTTEYLKSLIHQYDFDHARTWMIGNSVRTDVLPALENGLNAIHMKAQIEWQYNEAVINVKPQGAFFEIHSLHQVPEAIDNYTRNANYRSTVV
ncbi:HAD family hydrolase [Paenibacillus albiflavus]|uniref:HAD family hydrolase n=1 Tax=Paenibacillus albiflavus TaxID=2545760 RepID=A0A4R4EAR6_9BACL|nr:HAD family hydrolase [Paenibacillus albiflavus]TCZ76377.1 HAD family hydrolase [Paenibacillus albiflavus]